MTTKKDKKQSKHEIPPDMIQAEPPELRDTGPDRDLDKLVARAKKVRRKVDIRSTNRAVEPRAAQIRYLREEVASTMPVQMLDVLLIIARHPDISLGELEKHSGLSQASVSRNVSTLSGWTRHHKPGYGLVRTGEDPWERRRKIVRLTELGEQVIARLASLNRS